MPNYRRVRAWESTRLYPSACGCLNSFGQGNRLTAYIYAYLYTLMTISVIYTYLATSVIMMAACQAQAGHRQTCTELPTQRRKPPAEAVCMSSSFSICAWWLSHYVYVQSLCRLIKMFVYQPKKKKNWWFNSPWPSDWRSQNHRKPSSPSAWPDLVLGVDKRHICGEVDLPVWGLTAKTERKLKRKLNWMIWSEETPAAGLTSWMIVVVVATRNGAMKQALSTGVIRRERSPNVRRINNKISSVFFSLFFFSFLSTVPRRVNSFRLVFAMEGSSDQDPCWCEVCSCRVSSGKNRLKFVSTAHAVNVRK